MAESKISTLLDAGVLTRLMAQPLMTRFPMEGSISGHHRSPHRGSSVEFAEYRNYVPGDDLRRLDWRVFGRTDRFYMKEYEAETNLRCYLVVDGSGSMAFQMGHGRKIDLAKRIAATLAYLCIHQGDAAGLIWAGEKVGTEIPPKRTPAQIQLIAEQLEGAEPKGETGLIQALHDLAEKIRPRGLVVILSDLFCDTEGLLQALQHLRFRKHDVAVFHLLDQAEIDFQFDRPIRFVDLESSHSIITEPNIIRDEYLGQFRKFVELVRTGCQQFKAEYRMVRTDEKYDKVLGDFLAERAQAATVA